MIIPKKNRKIVRSIVEKKVLVFSDLDAKDKKWMKSFLFVARNDGRKKDLIKCNNLVLMVIMMIQERKQAVASMDSCSFFFFDDDDKDKKKEKVKNNVREEGQTELRVLVIAKKVSGTLFFFLSLSFALIGRRKETLL